MTEVSSSFYTPEEDVTEERNGVQFLVAAKGVAIPMAEARRLGLLKDQQKQAGPSETKEGTAPAQPRQEAPQGEGDVDVAFVPAPEFEAAVEEGEPKPKKGSK